MFSWFFPQSFQSNTESTQQSSITSSGAAEKDRKGRRKSLDAVNLKGKVVDSDESDVDDKLEEVGNTCWDCKYF